MNPTVQVNVYEDGWRFSTLECSSRKMKRIKRDYAEHMKTVTNRKVTFSRNKIVRKIPTAG